MFRKSVDVTLSSATLLRGKETKQLKDAAVFQFAASTEAVDKLFPGKSVESAKLGGTGKLLTYADSTDKLPIFIDLDPKAGLGRGKLLPSVIALWRSPDLLPALLIPAHVATFVLKGADLMWPGVFHDHLPATKLKKGAFVSIRVVGNPSPIAVGELLCSLEDAKEAGYRGRAVGVLHAYRDALWESSGRPLPNEGFLQNEIRPIADGADEIARIGTSVPSLGGVEDDVDEAGSEKKEGLGAAAGAGSAGPVADATSPDDAGEAAAKSPFWKELSADDLMRATLLQALKKHIKDKDLPVLAARLYGAIMQPCCPAGAELDIKATKWKKVGAFLHDMAAEGLLKLGSSSAGGPTGDDVAVTGVNRAHDSLAFFKPWPASMEQAVVTAAAAAAADGSAATSAAAAGGAAITSDGLIAPASSSVAGYRPPLFLSLYAPPAASYSIFRTVLRPSRKPALPHKASGEATPVGPVWSPQYTGFKTDEVKSASPSVVALLAKAALSTGKKEMSASAASFSVGEHAHDLHRLLDMKGRLFTQTEVVAALRSYIAEEGLAHPTDPSKIILDVMVADALVGDPRQDPKHDAPLFESTPAEDGEGDESSESGADGEEDDDDDGDAEDRPGPVPIVSAPDRPSKSTARDRDAASMSRVDVAKLWMKRMTTYTVVIFPNAAAAVSASSSGASASQASLASYLAGDAVLVRGPLPKVSISVKKLQGGRKHMTFISGLSSYRIDEGLFAKECSKRFATAASVTSAADAGVVASGDAKAKNVVQLQGDESEAIGELLLSAKEGYGLPKAVVKGLWDEEDEDTDSKKKKKGPGGGSKQAGASASASAGGGSKRRDNAAAGAAGSGSKSAAKR